MSVAASLGITVPSDQRRRWTDDSDSHGRLTAKDVFDAINALRDETARARHDHTNRMMGALSDLERRMTREVERVETKLDGHIEDDGDLHEKLGGKVDALRLQVGVVAAVISVIVFLVNLLSPFLQRFLDLPR